jgi:hypothetical protein
MAVSFQADRAYRPRHAAPGKLKRSFAEDVTVAAQEWPRPRPVTSPRATGPARDQTQVRPRDGERGP